MAETVKGIEMTNPNGRILPDLTTAFAKPTTAPTVERANSSPKSELSWQTLDVTSLSPDLQQQYYAYKQAEETAVKARKVFEKAMSIKLDLPPHIILRFGYRFGRLAVALDTDQRSKPRAASLSLEGLAHAIDNRK